MCNDSVAQLLTRKNVARVQSTSFAPNGLSTYMFVCISTPTTLAYALYQHAKSVLMWWCEEPTLQHAYAPTDMYNAPLIAHAVIRAQVKAIRKLAQMTSCTQRGTRIGRREIDAFSCPTTHTLPEHACALGINALKLEDH